MLIFLSMFAGELGERQRYNVAKIFHIYSSSFAETALLIVLITPQGYQKLSILKPAFYLVASGTTLSVTGVISYCTILSPNRSINEGDVTASTQKSRYQHVITVLIDYGLLYSVIVAFTSVFSFTTTQMQLGSRMMQAEVYCVNLVTPVAVSILNLIVIWTTYSTHTDYAYISGTIDHACWATFY